MMIYPFPDDVECLVNANCSAVNFLNYIEPLVQWDKTGEEREMLYVIPFSAWHFMFAVFKPKQKAVFKTAGHSVTHGDQNMCWTS